MLSVVAPSQCDWQQKSILEALIWTTVLTRLAVVIVFFVVWSVVYDLQPCWQTYWALQPLSPSSAAPLGITHPLEPLVAARVSPGSLGRANSALLCSATQPVCSDREETVNLCDSCVFLIVVLTKFLLVCHEKVVKFKIKRLNSIFFR